MRDRFGIRPLYYALRGDALFWGSEVKAIVAHPTVQARLDPRAVLHQLMQTIVPGTSAFADVLQVQPGHLLRVRRVGGRLELETHRYWDLDSPTEADRPAQIDEQEHIERIRDELIRAVLRLEADVPVGCYSGGIDSCCILGLATGAMQSLVTWPHRTLTRHGCTGRWASRPSLPTICSSCRVQPRPGRAQ